MRTLNKHSDTAMLATVSALRRRLRMLLFRINGK
jgi:hypothetical protein